MGFDCKICGEREIWDFETLEYVCISCFFKLDDWVDKFKTICKRQRDHLTKVIQINSCYREQCYKLGLEPEFLGSGYGYGSVTINKEV